MAHYVIPLFRQFPQEAAIIGRLVVGYGELEFELCACLGIVLADSDAAVRTVFRARGEAQRILIADALMREKFNAKGLINPYSEAIADMNWCRQIRNQFAHCHWGQTRNRKNLGFYDFDEAAKSPLGTVTLKEKTITLPVLEAQEEYFWYVMECFWHLQHEYIGGSHSHALPKKVARPPKYSATP